MKMGIGMKHPSLAAMVDAIKSKISRESLHERFTESAALFIEVCTQFVLRNKFQIPPLYTKLLKTFQLIIQKGDIFYFSL